VKRRGRRWLRAVIPPAAVLVLILVTLVVHARQQPDPAEPSFLSPVSDAGDGGADLAARLAQRGVAVDRRTSTPQAIAAVVADGDATLFVTAPEMVHPDYLAELRMIPVSTRIVLVAPTAGALAATGVSVPLSGPRWTAAAPEPGCAEPFATAPAAVLRWRFGPVADARFRCYADGVVEVDGGGPPVTLVGASDPFRNDRLDEHGNAAFAVGLLARGTRVVWLDLHEPEQLPAVPNQDGTDPGAEPEPDPERPPEQEEPDSGDGPGDQGEAPPAEPPPRPADRATADNPLARAFPPAFWATALILVLAVLALAAASARRLGAPVAEPLPTAVRAAETVRGLGGLYRRARARDASLGTLQAAAIKRLAAHVGMPPDSGVDDVAQRVAAHVGWPPHEMRALLGGGVEDTDEDLAAKAAAVQGLVRRVTEQQGTGQQAIDEGNGL
jgi:hypothetical protein